MSHTVTGMPPLLNGVSLNPLREAHKARLIRDLQGVQAIITNWRSEHPEDAFTNAIQVWAEGFLNSLQDSLNLGQVENLFVQQLQEMICPQQNADGHARAFPIDENPIYDTRSHQTYGAKAYIFYLLGSTRENRQIGLQLVSWMQNREDLQELPFRPHPVVKRMVEWLKKRNAFFYPEGIDEAYQNALAAPSPRQRDVNGMLNRLFSEEDSLELSSSDEGLSTGISDEEDETEFETFSLQREQVDSARRTASMIGRVNANSTQMAEEARRNATTVAFQSFQQNLLAEFAAADRTSQAALAGLAESAAAFEAIENEPREENQDLAALAARLDLLDANIERVNENEQRDLQQAEERLEQERDQVQNNLEQAAAGNTEALEAVQEAIIRIVRPNIEENLRALEARDRRIESRLNQFEQAARAQSAAFERRITQVAQRAQELQGRISSHVYAVQQLDVAIEGAKKDVEVLRQNIEATRQAVEELKERRESNTWQMVARIGVCIVVTVALNYMIDPTVIVFPTGDRGIGVVGHF